MYCLCSPPVIPALDLTALVAAVDGPENMSLFRRCHSVTQQNMSLFRLCHSVTQLLLLLLLHIYLPPFVFATFADLSDSERTNQIRFSVGTQWIFTVVIVYYKILQEHDDLKIERAVDI